MVASVLSVTTGLVHATKECHPDLCVLQIDAHPDLMESFQGSKHSHACAMKRVLDMGVQVSAVGIRCIAKEEWRVAQEQDLRLVTARECHTSQDWMDRVLASLRGPVYITMDIDAFDPAFAPGTGTPEPGGLNWYQVIELLRRVTSEKTVVGADIVEVMPIPGQVVTEFLAARLAYKLICYMQDRDR